MSKEKTEILTKDSVLNHINNLNGFRGYVQFSHREIDINKDLFINSDPKVTKEDGFIYEAHFANDSEYVTIKQLNDKWIANRGSLENSEIQEYYGIGGIKVKMAQIWEEDEDELCKNMIVKKLKKVVFAGFAQGGQK